MAIYQSGSGVDYLKLGILKDFLQNPLTTAQRNSLATTLGSGHKGLSVYDTDESLIYHWNGAAFATNPATQSGLTPKGSIAFNGTEPASPVLGDLYVFSSAGTNTWEGSTEVQIGDQTWWDGAAWQFIQVNVAAASETVPGYIEIATTSETNTGTDDARAVTPSKLASWRSNKKIAGVYFVSGASIVADTPLTVNHALALQNRNSFVLMCFVSNSKFDVDIDSTDVNNCTVTSGVSVTADIVVIGF